MHKCLTGLDVNKPQAEDVFDYDDMTHAKVIGKISAPHGLGYLEAFRRRKICRAACARPPIFSPARSR
jgi:hypothetical protein